MHRRVHQLAERTARRLQWQRTVSVIRSPLLVLGAVWLLLAVWDRWPGGPRVDWWAMAWCALAMGVLWFMWSWWKSRATPLEGAIVLDEALETGEALSTSLATPSTSSDLAAAAVHAEAGRRAASIDGRRGPAAAVPVKTPEGWWWGLLLMVPAVALLFFEPLPSRQAVADEGVDLATARSDAEASVAMVQAQLKQSPELVADMDLEMDWDAVTQSDDPAEIRRDALRQMTELSRRLNAYQDSAATRRTEAVRQQLKQAAPGAGEGMAGAIRRAMASGDMEAMAETIERARYAGTAEDAEALRALAEDVRTSADDRAAVSDALRGAGLDPALADAPDTLTDAINDAAHLSMQQKEDLQQLAETTTQATQTMDELADELDDVAGQCEGSASDQDDAAKASATSESGQPQNPETCPSQQLARQQVVQRQAAQCQQACQGGGTPDQSTMAGAQANRPGRGGPQAMTEEDPSVALTQSRLRQSVDQQATVVQSTDARGVIIPGDATATAGQAVRQARRRFTEGVDVQSVPRRYREAVAAWFTAMASEESAEDGAKAAPETASEKDRSP